MGGECILHTNSPNHNDVYLLIRGSLKRICSLCDLS